VPSCVEPLREAPSCSPPSAFNATTHLAPPPTHPPSCRAAKKWTEAAQAYMRSGQSYNRCKSEHEAATALIEAARCWIKAGDPHKGTEVLESEALPRIVDAGRLSQAAKLHNEVRVGCAWSAGWWLQGVRGAPRARMVSTCARSA